MKAMTLTDDYGRSHMFTGELLVSDTTDTDDERKPQWVEIDVWRTEGGSYVVQVATHYRVRHTSVNCSRADGYELAPADSDDTYACPGCNKGDHPGGWGQLSRINVDAYRTPAELIESFKQNGQHTNFGRAILAEISNLDDAVDAAWNTVVIP